jgi:hypothetical protein
MRLLMVPQCPNCGGCRSTLRRTAANLARLVAATVAGLLVADVVPVHWRCAACGEVFAAIGIRAVGGPKTGLPVIPPSANSDTDDEARPTDTP